MIVPQDSPAAGPALASFLTRRRVTHLTVGPAVLATMPPDSLPSVEVLVTAGEACGRELVARWIPGRVVVNAYGPTETTVCATMSSALTPGETPPLGEALPGLRALVLDDDLRAARPGTIAELFVAGDGVAAGYLGQPGLTAERFLACPDGPPGTRMYRTGDLVRVLDGHRLEFAGRADEQFKIHGFRIEPAEVVSALLAHPAIAQAVVLPHENDTGERRLVAYLVRAAEAAAAPGPAQLRKFLHRSLPPHLVPSVYTTIAAIPITANGKVDHARLPAPVFAAATVAADGGTPTGQALCGIFAEVLGLPAVGPEDEFFDVGGTSLDMIEVISRITERFGIELPLAEFFRAPTAGELAAVLERLS